MSKGGRPDKHNWEEIHNYYKAGMSQAEICKRFTLSKSTLSEKVKKDKWVVSEQVTERLKGVISAVEAVSELSVGEQRAVSEIVDETLKRKEVFNKSALGNQSVANLALNAIRDAIVAEKDVNAKATRAMMLLPALESHGKITEKNKTVVFGKEPDTNVVVNNAVQQNMSVQHLSDDELAEQASKFGIELKR